MQSMCFLNCLQVSLLNDIYYLCRVLMKHTKTLAVAHRFELNQRGVSRKELQIDTVGTDRLGPGHRTCKNSSYVITSCSKTHLDFFCCSAWLAYHVFRFSSNIALHGLAIRVSLWGSSFGLVYRYIQCES